jgi:hypothetical protein
MVKDLAKTGKNDDEEDDDDKAGTLSNTVYSDFLAALINNGDTGIIDAVKNICLGDNNTKLLSYSIINGIVKSSNAELYKLLGGLLLAAKLQEGLRQSILENADNGRIEALAYFMGIAADNDLLRYSSALRAVDVWMGLGEEAEDKRIAEKLLRLGILYLNNAGERKAALQSRDAIEIYASLWAVSAYEANDITEPVSALLNGEKYQKLIALYFLNQLENPALQFILASKAIETAGNDLDVLSLAVINYRVNTGWNQTRESFSEHCKEYGFIADKDIRDRHFDLFINLIPLVPAKGHTSSGKPFDWCFLSLSPADIFSRLLVLAAYDWDKQKVSRLVDHIPRADSGSREEFLKYFLDNPAGEKERRFVFDSLNDKSMTVRSQALKNILQLKPDEGEAKLIVNLLALKTGDLRQNALKILLELDWPRPLEAAKVLLSDKNENKRLAGLDMITTLKKSEKINGDEAADLIALMPKVSDKEQVLINALKSKEAKYNKANGFGLYDPSYAPQFPPLEIDPRHRLETIFDFSFDRITRLFDSLRSLIEAHKDYTYKLKMWDKSIVDQQLGTLTYPRSSADADDSSDDENGRTVFEKFVLHDVWRSWIKDNQVNFADILVFMFLNKVQDYNDEWELEYVDWVNGYLEKHFNYKGINKLIKYFHKKEYGELALNLICILWTEYPEDERFSFVYGASADLIKSMPEEDWKKSIYTKEDRYRDQDSSFSDTDEAEFFLDMLKTAVQDNGHFKKYLALCFELGRLADMFYTNLSELDIARAVDMGVLKPDALYRTMFLSDGDYIGHYSGKVEWRNYKKNAEKYPLLKKAADESANRVIEIELERGDSGTEVSHHAVSIRRHEGADTFAKILIALGEEPFVRGYIYSKSNTKKEVLSSLLKNCHPGAADTADTLRAALCGKISDRRLIEAAMYSPSWINIVQDYLGWPGLKSTVWYFHAHVNEMFSAEKETEAARFSPISSEDFRDGAFDINWFKDAYTTLGQDRFDLVYNCAKYLTDGANHRRAQLFADAALGKLNIEELEQGAREKRNRDKLLSYSLVPLSADIQKDALHRYEFIQSFLKESKSFGAQRRASESKAAQIALDNLARTAGYSDALRFSWGMETRKIKEIERYFTPHSAGEVQVSVVIDENGIASLALEKNGNQLASVPSALKKDAYIAECKDVVSSLKAQQKRAKENLERSMVNRDIFEYGEIKTLLGHPVLAPLLRRLVFVSTAESGAVNADTKAGFPDALSALQDNTKVRIAHPYDLYTGKTWLNFQHSAFEQKLVQPFKQIFRELYLINEDEKAEKTISRRYAGHQVQPHKTVALLKSRGWTVDYEEGLQRVYYKENIIAALYAKADWFSPADTESPTLETVQFFDRKKSKPADLESIPPVIFSEVMRDIDLVVSVAHVGGVDPEASHSTIEMRAVLVRELLSLLRVENVTVEEKHAKVKGSLGEYTVHLGSAQVHKMGKGAVNRLAVPSQHRGRIFLPFADDDPRTAEVMSKVLLLADDAHIKDPAILSQIE